MKIVQCQCLLGILSFHSFSVSELKSPAACITLTEFFNGWRSQQIQSAKFGEIFGVAISVVVVLIQLLPP